MDTEIQRRLEKIEEKLDLKKKDAWDKLQSLAGILIPVSIALVGWYYTNANNKNQLEIQQINNDNQFQIALVNSNVGQSELIKDFIQHLTSKDSAARNIAIEAILYAAPTPGKKIVEVLSKTSDQQTRLIAMDALSGKRTDLTAGLFSNQKQTRLIAANEITGNWSNDALLLTELLNRTEDCLKQPEIVFNCSDGVYNFFAVAASFSKQLLQANKQKILALAESIPAGNAKTKKLAMDLAKSL